MLLICSLLFIFATVVSSITLVPLNGRCSVSLRCIGGSICIDNICKCPTTAMPSPDGCIYSDDPTVPNANFLPVHIAPQTVQPPQPPVAQPVVKTISLDPYQRSAAPQFWIIPSTLSQGAGQWFSPGIRPSLSPVLIHPIPVQQPQYWNNQIGLMTAPTTAVAHNPPLPKPDPPVVVYALPGSSCSNGKTCINSVCNQDVCTCAPNHALIEHTCVEIKLVQVPPPVPAPSVPTAPVPIPTRISLPAPAPAPVPLPIFPRPMVSGIAAPPPHHFDVPLNSQYLLSDPPHIPSADEPQHINTLVAADSAGPNHSVQLGVVAHPPQSSFIKTHDVVEPQLIPEPAPGFGPTALTSKIFAPGPMPHPAVAKLLSGSLPGQQPPSHSMVVPK